MQINVRSNIVELRKDFEATTKKVELAAAIALTRTAKEGQAAHVAEMARVFDRPTRYTLQSVYIRPATVQKLVAKAWIKDDTSKGTPAENYLGPQIEGGKRKRKRFEKALIAKGIMNANDYAVPGAGARLDANGNIQPSQIVQILAWVEAFGQQGYKANSTAKTRARTTKRTGKSYFVARSNGSAVASGIWERQEFAAGAGKRPVLIFVDGVRYKKLLGWAATWQATAEREFPIQFEKALVERGVAKR
jgi:hypothetical protein